MECIDRILYRKINPSDFKKLYDIDRPLSGGGQTYLEAAGISNEDIVDFLAYAEISDSPLKDEKRSIYTFNAHVLGNASEMAPIEFAPRGGRNNYRISRQTMRYKHPAWRPANGFPEPKRDPSGEYISGNFVGIIDNLVILILRTTYRKYYAGYVDASEMPLDWPVGIGLEDIFQGDRRGVIKFSDTCISFFDSKDNPFGDITRGVSPEAPLSYAGEDEYEIAAAIIINHINENSLQFTYQPDEVEAVNETFVSRFAPNKLAVLKDDELLRALFYTQDDSNDSLCYELEFQPQVKEMFGSIAGGSSFKFGLFQRKEDGKWLTGSPNKPQELTEHEALELGKGIRDALVTGSELIANRELESKDDYELLDADLNDRIGKYANYGWIQKYFQMIHSDKLAAYYSSDWQNHILYALGITPSDKYYGRNGQIAIIRKLTGLNNNDFAEACEDKFGNPKRFLRLGCTIEESGNMAEEWLHKGVVSIGWPGIGSLDEYRQGNTLNRKALTDALREKYYPDDPSIAARKAGEIQNFFNSGLDTVFIVMNGEKSIALVDGIGDYYFDSHSAGCVHCKPGMWHQCFSSNEDLPEKSEGKLTTCVEIKKSENLKYLYQKYYYDLDEVEDNAMSKETPYIPVKYHTGIRSPFAANRIMFGAPGTGKSYRLEQDRKTVLQNGAVGGYERVTFHPDYTYSQFVGTYKPVTDRNGAIRYQFVPGPFMRVYVDALKSGRSDNPQPFILLIEEINRANVAAVFGDVFQLLDRDSDNISEYPIQATEDIRNYLASQLGGTADNYLKIQIPDNMFIWATMNSADQGVFPMDTAFKRRWDFTYLGIDNGEDQIKGKTVLLGEGEHQRTVEWNRLRKEINNVLLNDCRVNEDKLMGPFFIAKKNLPDGDIIDPDSFKLIFKNKVIMYLFDDAAKQKRPTLFDGCDNKNLYSAICNEFDKKGVDIFSESVRNAFPINTEEDIES